jgi:hypothetical protein
MYFVSRNAMVTAGVLRAVCKSYNMDSLSIDSLEEFEALKEILSQNDFQYVRKKLHFGAIATVALTTTDWYSLSSGKRLPFPIKFTRGNPSNNEKDEYCLEADYSDGLAFNDISCTTLTRNFICERKFSVTQCGD